MGFKETEVGRIPEEWELFELKDLAQKIGSGATPRGGKKVYLQSGIPFIRSQNIYNCKFLKDGIVYINEESASKLNNVKLYKNDVLLNITGDSVARCTMLPEKYIGGRVNQHVVIIRSHVEILNPNFLKYYLVSDNMQAYMLSLAKMGATRAALTKGMIESFKVPTPPIKEQKAIANILSTLDEKIEINNRINKNLEQIAQTIFKHWFVDFEFPDEDGNPYKSSGGEMVESELGMIPRGWEVGSLGDIIDISSGKRPKKKTKESNQEFYIPLVGASSIMGFVKEYNYREAVIVIGRVGTHGVIQRFNYKIWASDNTLVIRSKYYEYVNQLLRLIDYSSLNRGSTQPLITQTDIKKEKIIIPNKKLLSHYEKLIGKIYQFIDINSDENKALTNLRDTLLPKLMSGEIRVPLNN